jgi:hypothetical protein
MLFAGIDEAQHSQYVLLEQLNFHDMRKCTAWMCKLLR